MKPIAIFRHAPHEGPGHFATFCDAHDLPWKLIRIDAGDPVPATPEAYSGLVFMGGPMSVNDDLPWIPPVLALIRAAAAADIPVLGHCLGGQLMARALGGAVGRNAIKEIGWGAVRVLNSPTARDWFGPVERFESFHWHGETFTPPVAAERILESAHCANQAFALGPHLALQCHVEMTDAMVRSWCDVGAEEIAAALTSRSPGRPKNDLAPTGGGSDACSEPGAQMPSPAVQSPEQMLALNAANLPAMRAVAEQLYGRWIQGLRG